MSQPLLNSNQTSRSSAEDELDYSEDISLDNGWVPNEKRPSCMVIIIGNRRWRM